MPPAYQDENGKWWKQCSTTKELFGGVDNKEDLSEWFSKDKNTKDGFCFLCKGAEKIKNNQFYQNNKKDKIKETRKKHYENNKEKIKQKRKEYYYNNKEKIKEYIKSPRGMHKLYKASAKHREINFTLSLEWFEEQIKLSEFNYCAISGIKFVDGEISPFSRSLDRLDSVRGYEPDNVKWVCYKLNSWKSDLTLHEVSLIFKYMSESYGYDPIEYLRETIQKVS
jgi:hypothetical protein